METKQQTFDDLIEQYHNYLLSINRCADNIRHYQYEWQRIKKFMLLHQIDFYDRKIGDRYLAYILGEFEYSKLPRLSKKLVNMVDSFAKFQETGVLKRTGATREAKPKIFENAIGATMINFLSNITLIENLKSGTVAKYKTCLYKFYSFLDKEGIFDIEQINLPNIFQFFKELDPLQLSAKSHALQVVKCYLKYLYEQQLLGINHSKDLPQCTYKQQARLPSTFSKEEIKTLLATIDQGDAKGKRDYAMILLATKLGLRASDIVALKFENILWEQSLIKLSQQKTGKSLSLPLLPEIGNAIINYLKHGLPVSKESYLFLQAHVPYSNISPHSFTKIVEFNIKRANIDCTNRKHGPHSLRHSFAGNLLKGKTPMPIISEALGHSQTESTMYYLRIDTTTLSQCALNVPLVPTSFYAQERRIIR
jgi:site-specific recombinase XerD